MGQLSTATCLTCFTSAPPPQLTHCRHFCPVPLPLPSSPPLLGGPGQLAMTNSPCRTINHESRWPICALKDEPLPSHWMRWHWGGGQQPQEAGRWGAQWLLCRATGPLLPTRCTFPGVALYPVTPPKGRALSFTPQQPLPLPHSGYKSHPAPCFCHRCTLHEPQNMPPISCSAGRPTPSRWPMGEGRSGLGPSPSQPLRKQPAGWIASAAEL